jgi:integrase
MDRPAPVTFATVTDARIWLATVETDMLRGKWIDPTGGRVLLGDYAERWITNRADLANRTREKYAGLIKLHIGPAFGRREMARVEPSAVRGWWAKLAQTHPTTAAGAYRLLNSIYRTAVADGIVARNPCQVRGGGIEHAAERPVANVAEVAALADAMPTRLRAAVLLAAWCGLRRGELLALRRRDLGLLQRTVDVRQAAEHLSDGSIGYKSPKTAAGRRRVAIPSNIVDDLAAQLATYVADDRDALVFTGDKGGPLRPHVLAAHWRAATKAVGLAGFRFHDLRHTSNTWAAATGASTRELMARMGHASPTAALGYQHATADRDRVLADALAGLAGVPAPATVTSIDEANRS